MAKEHLKVIAGIDTHADTHHVAVITGTGQHLADREFPATGSGYRGIIDFVTGFGAVLALGWKGPAATALNSHACSPVRACTSWK